MAQRMYRVTYRYGHTLTRSIQVLAWGPQFARQQADQQLSFKPPAERFITVEPV